MKTSSFKQAIEAQFDCLSKKVIKRAVKKGYRDMKRREKRECPFSDIPDYEQERFGTFDKYESDYTVFNILGIEVWVEDDQLSEALKTLTKRNATLFCCPTLWICLIVKSANLSKSHVLTSSIIEQKHSKQ